MAEVSLLVMLAIVLVSAIVIFKVGKGVVKTIAIIGAVASIAVAVAGGFVVKDAFDLRDNFQAQDNILLFSDKDGKLITAGAVMKGQAGNVNPLTASELEKLNSLFAKKDYQSMRGKNYKLFVINENLLTSATAEKPGISSEESRATMLAGLFGLKISQDPLFLISEYKSGNATIYPETAVFKAIKILPISLFKRVTQKAFQQAKETAKEKL